MTQADFDALYDAGTGTEQIGLGSKRILLRSDGTYWLLADSDSPTIPRSAAEIPETTDRKWAAESGADVTGNHTAAAIVGQGELATMDTVGTSQISAEAVSQVASAFTAEGTPIGDTETTEQQVTITTTGGVVIIFWGAGVEQYSSDTPRVKLRLYRDTTLLTELAGVQVVALEEKMAFTFLQETPTAAQHTYYLKARTLTTGTWAYLAHREIVVMELKR